MADQAASSRRISPTADDLDRGKGSGDIPAAAAQAGGTPEEGGTPVAGGTPEEGGTPVGGGSDFDNNSSGEEDEDDGGGGSMASLM